MTTGGTASLILFNGKVITVNERSEISTAIAIEGRRILAHGSDRDIRALAGPDTAIVDLGGRAVIPGLIDGHAHMDREGLKLALPSLAGARDVDAVVGRIARIAARRPKGEWIVTMPLGDPPEFEFGTGGTRLPNRWDLDRAAPDNPVYIRSIWGYWRNDLPLVSVANSVALALAGVGRDTAAPVPSVTIERDAGGEPTGIFIDWNKMPVVELSLMARAPGFTVEARAAALSHSMRVYNSFGSTSVFEGHGAASDVLSAYQRVRCAGKQTVRATLVFSPAWNAVPGSEPAMLLAAWGRWLAGRGLGDDWLRVHGLYAEIDDSTERAVRARAFPQTGWAGFHYDSSLPRAALKELLIAAAGNGVRVIGILPNMLDLFAEVAKVADFRDQRWSFGHITALTEGDVSRIRDLGLVVTTHTSAYIHKRGAELKQKLGTERENDIVPLRRLLDAGVPVSLATDNVPPSLFHSIWHAVGRRTRGDTERVAPAQAIGRDEALRCATMGGAFLTFAEASKGSIEPGKLADLAVLSHDPLTCREDEIKDIVAELVIVDGRIAFDRSSPDHAARPEESPLAP